MTKERIENWLGNRMKDHPGNVISADFAIRPELVGVHFFDEPLVGIGSAEDPLFDEYKKEGVIGPWHLSPKEWMPEANTVVSVFFPFTEEVRRSNRETEGEPSAEWLHGRIEGQAFLADTMRELAAWMNEQNVPTLVPEQDERFQSVMGGQGITGYENINEKTYGSRWSERHAAYVCGLGTFGLSKGIITEKGMAGRFGSLVTVMEAEPDVRKYSGLYDYCIFCGACIRRCPVQTISFEEGKKHPLCHQKLMQTKRDFAPRLGCGKCQTGVPCESRIPEKKTVDSRLYI